MLFKQYHLQGIRSGSITLAFRKWKKPTVKKGSLLKTAIGQVEILNITAIDAKVITEQEARHAGFESLKTLLEQLDSIAEGQLYRIALQYHSPDPRLALRNEALFSPEEFQSLTFRLNHLDQFSRYGNWTLRVLGAIRLHPKMKATNLAKLLEYEKDWLKLNIRKLKNLGLTISHNPGYELSPRGKAFLDKIDTLSSTPSQNE